MAEARVTRVNDPRAVESVKRVFCGKNADDEAWAIRILGPIETPESTRLVALLAELDDVDTRAAVTAERALLAELEAGCSAPVGAIAEVVESIDEDGRVFEELSLRSCVAALDGSDVIRASGIGSPDRARELGLSVAAELFDLGAREVMSSAR